MQELGKFSSVNQVLLMKTLRNFDNVTGEQLGDTYMEKVSLGQVPADDE